MSGSGAEVEVEADILMIALKSKNYRDFEERATEREREPLWRLSYHHSDICWKCTNQSSPIGAEKLTPY